jgi:hypothetical protein
MWQFLANVVQCKSALATLQFFTANSTHLTFIIYRLSARGIRRNITFSNDISLGASCSDDISRGACSEYLSESSFGNDNNLYYPTLELLCTHSRLCLTQKYHKHIHVLREFSYLRFRDVILQIVFSFKLSAGIACCCIANFLTEYTFHRFPKGSVSPENQAGIQERVKVHQCQGHWPQRHVCINTKFGRVYISLEEKKA